MDIITLGTVDEFHSKKCFELYLFAVKLAEQINTYIDLGYIIINDDKFIKNKFVFRDEKEPYVALRNGNSSRIYVGGCYDNNYKVWLHGEFTKKSIFDIFCKFKMVKPENIEYVKFD